MRHPDIWAKFVTSSQFMERKCYEFDVAYTWGANNQYSPGEPRLPVRANGQPTAGLGDLYCYWIDMHLSNIEAKAKTWFLSARQSFDADFGSGTQGKKWLTNAMQDRGPIDRLYFVKSPRGHQSPAGGANVWRNSNYNGLWSTGYGAAGPF